MTIDPQGDLWVTDSAAHAVFKFGPDGRLLMTLGKKGVAGDNTSRLHPTATSLCRTAT